MASGSSTSAESMLESQVSSKPWHLTFFDKQVYIWKSGSRMKLKNGSSSGPVTTSSILMADVVNVSTNK